MTVELEKSKLEGFLKRYDELQRKNLSQDAQLTKAEGAELDSLRRLLSQIEDKQVQQSIDQSNLAAQEEAKRQAQAARRNRRRASEAVAEATTKLAFDKEKKPNLTEASTCFLRDNIESFIIDSYKKNKLGWPSFTCIHDDGTARIPLGSAINGFSFHSVKSEDKKNTVAPLYEFLNIPTINHTDLKEKVRLTKLFIGSDNKIKNEVEINLPTDGIEKIGSELLSNYSSDAGLKRVRVDFRNQNPFAAGRMVDVELEIFMNGGAAFTKPRGFSYYKKATSAGELEKNSYSIKDLLLRNSQLDPEKYDAEHYGIRLQIGYERPNLSTGKNQRLEESIMKNSISMILQLIEYDINFGQNGTISLTLQYKGRIEALFEDKTKYDIFDYKGYTRDEISSTATAIGDIQEQKDALALEISQTQYALKTFQDEAFFRSRGGKYEAGQAYNALMLPALAGVAGTFGTGAFGLLAADLLYGDDRKYFEQQTERMSVVNKGIEDAAALLAEKTKKLESLDEKLTQLERDYAILKQENKVLKYSRILERMYEKKKIHNVVVTLEELILYGKEYQAAIQNKIDIIKDNPALSEEEKQARILAIRSVEAASRGEKSRQVQREINRQTVQPGSNLIQKVKDQIKERAKEIADKETGDKNGIITEDIYKQAAGTISVSGLLEENQTEKPKEGVADSSLSLKNKKRIYYFYFGDLLDTVLRLNPDAAATIDLQMERDKNGIILGPCFLQLRQNQVIIANIADLPISLELYQQFFYKNVVEKDVDQYNLNQFIKDALNQLVAVSLNQRCAGESVASPVSVQSNLLALSSNYNQAFIDAFMSRTIGQGGGYEGYNDFDMTTNCPLRNLADIDRYMDSKTMNAIQTQTAGNATYSNRLKLNNNLTANISNLRLIAETSPANDIWNYICYYLEPNGFKRRLNGEVAADSAKGIHHLYLGRDRGLVKNVNFSKNKKAGMHEMMVERAFAKGEESLELWHQFNLDIKMVGTSMFKPGMHFYLNPTIPGFGQPTDKKSLSRTLGLGGYYIITSVSNELVPGWETNIKAVWVSYPIDPADFTYKIIDPLSDENLLRGHELDRILVSDQLGQIAGAEAGIQIVTAPASTTGVPKGKGKLKPVSQHLRELFNSLKKGGYDGTQSEFQTITNLNREGASYRTIIENRYYNAAQTNIEGGNTFKYTGIAQASIPGQSNPLAEKLIAEYEAYRNSSEAFGLGLKDLDDIPTFKYEVDSPRSKSVTFRGGSGELVTALFIGYEGENTTNSEAVIVFRETNDGGVE